MDPEELGLVSLAQPYADEDRASMFLESLRWPNGVVCPHCRRRGAYALTPRPESRRPVRKGVWKCRSCRRQFTVRVGTFFEDSHIPLSKWVMAVSILCASRKGIGSKQLERMLGLSYKTAWFMSHRLRQAMAERPFRNALSKTGDDRRKKPSRRGRSLRNKVPAAPAERVAAKIQRQRSMENIATGATLNHGGDGPGAAVRE